MSGESKVMIFYASRRFITYWPTRAPPFLYSLLFFMIDLSFILGFNLQHRSIIIFLILCASFHIINSVLRQFLANGPQLLTAGLGIRALVL